MFPNMPQNSPERVQEGPQNECLNRSTRLVSCAGWNMPLEWEKIVSFALGNARAHANRIMNATSEHYNACLLTLEPGIQARVLSAETRIKRRLASTITDKAAYLEHIPHSVCAIFGQFCGYPLESCQGKLKESFAEYVANEDVARHNPVCEFYFSRKSIVSMQLWECANGRSSLVDCPEAFVSIQERAFATTVARRVEGEHSKTKWATQRGLRHVKPALGCAHQRHV